MVIIDSLSRMYEGGIEDSALAKRICLKLRELTDRLKVTMIVIHHTPKQMGRPLTQDSLAGSRILIQEADFLIGIGKTAEGRTYDKDIAFRYKEVDNEFVIEFTIDSNQWLQIKNILPESELLREADGRKENNKGDLVTDAIELLSKELDRYPSGKDLEVELVETNCMSRATMYNWLKKLALEGIIENLGGKYKVV